MRSIAFTLFFLLPLLSAVAAAPSRAFSLRDHDFYISGPGDEADYISGEKSAEHISKGSVDAKDAASPGADMRFDGPPGSGISYPKDYKDEYKYIAGHKRSAKPHRSGRSRKHGNSLRKTPKKLSQKDAQYKNGDKHNVRVQTQDGHVRLYHPKNDDVQRQTGDVQGQISDTQVQGDNLPGQKSDKQAPGNNLPGQKSDKQAQGDQVPGQKNVKQTQGDNGQGQKSDKQAQGVDMQGQIDDMQHKTTKIQHDGHDELTNALGVTASIRKSYDTFWNVKNSNADDSKVKYSYEKSLRKIDIAGSSEEERKQY